MVTGRGGFTSRLERKEGRREGRKRDKTEGRKGKVGRKDERGE